MAKERIQYFDILKGIAIFLVVMGHVLTMCIRDIDNDFLFKLIERVHMPIFFFISGYFSYKIAEDGVVQYPKIGQRALQLLLPFVVVSALWILYFPHSGLQSPIDSTFTGMYGDVWKSGYWFTPVLFGVILLYLLLVPLFRKVKNDVVLAAVLIVIWLFMALIQCYFGYNQWAAYCSYPIIVKFVPVFFLGAFARRKKELFSAISGDNHALTISLLVSCILMYVSCYSWEFSISDNLALIISALLALCIPFVAIIPVKIWSERVFSKHPEGNVYTRVWTYLGQESLGIYLLHYFFLFPLTFLQEPMRAMGLGFVPSLVVSAFVAALIVAVTVGVNYIISQSKLLSLLLIGKNQYKS